MVVVGKWTRHSIFHVRLLAYGPSVLMYTPCETNCKSHQNRKKESLIIPPLWSTVSTSPYFLPAFHCTFHISCSILKIQFCFPYFLILYHNSHNIKNLLSINFSGSTIFHYNVPNFCSNNAGLWWLLVINLCNKMTLKILMPKSWYAFPNVSWWFICGSEISYVKQ